MNLVSLLVSLVSPVMYVFNCYVKHSDPIRHLRENLQSLEEAKRELEAISRDVESKVSQLEEQQRSRRTNEVQNWLETVDRTLKEVEDTLQRGDQEIKKRCLGNWCAKNCCSTRNFGKEVIKKLTAVKELVSKGHFDVVADKLPPAAVDVRPMEKTMDNEDDRAAELFRRLSNRKFVLLLDDIWQRIDLSKVGVPVLDTCKIVFTTRSEDVCNHMEAHERFKVECLSPEVAWDLFQQKLGTDALNSHREIPKHAKIVVNECKGLPLALITIGRAMASRRKLEEWQYAIKVLQSYPSEFPGMEDTVLLILKFSYDSLANEFLKSCFIYCAIYPEDHVIDEDELIDLWIGEGFLRDIDNIYDARN
ncbi:hypothetical protein LWI28_013936 [Acer negundo]|uniref:NB-ARC domain-containing protein n=1 Tax=Acer negundo TaxID=4023 RepID=A0AAD5IDU9_ACENE|nr:hypothetical protein LWI28_013936 [Acer negundo]